MIDKSNGTPIYVQLKAIFKERIAAGDYQVGQVLPSEREICQTYGISRMTARQAISELASEGYLYKVQGKGTFVSSGKIEQNLTALTSFSEDMIRMGRKPGGRILEIRNLMANAPIAGKLGLAIGEDVLLFSRIRTADGQPISIEKSYLNGKLVRGIDMGGRDNFSLYQYLRSSLRIQLARAVQSIETTLLTGRFAEQLEVADPSLGLLMNRTTYDSKGRPVEYAESYYRGDIYKFVIELKSLEPLEFSRGMNEL